MDDNLDSRDFSHKTWRRLHVLGIRKLSQLTEFSSEKLLNCRNIGNKTLDEIRKYLASKNLHLKGDSFMDETMKDIMLSVPSILDDTIMQIKTMKRMLSLVEHRLSYLHEISKEK